jgi:hypothetical protein
MPTPSRSGIPSSRSHEEHWERYGIKPQEALLYVLAHAIGCAKKAHIVWKQTKRGCLEMGPIKINFVLISGHFSGKCCFAFKTKYVAVLQLL